MKLSKRLLKYAPLGIAAAAVALGGVVRAADTMSVGSSQLENADADANSWLTYGRDLQGRRYSPLTSVDAASVGGLRVAWKKNLGPAVAMEATPLVSQGVMYLTTGNSTVYALDAKTGATKWKYVYPLPLDSLSRACCDTDNRGVTLSGNKVYLGTLDAHLVALDAQSGKVVWNVTVAPTANAYSITSPPLPVKNMVITGAGNGEYPTRGFIAAYDANSGRQLWRRYTIPGPGEAGYETWLTPGVAKRGGAPTWLPGTYDAKRDTLYWGTGNPNPDWDANSLKGSLLYSSSLLALSPETGAIKWHYQFTPHDIWDFDSVSEPMLVDVPIGGKDVAGIAHADRNGYLYLLDRDTHKVIYAVPFLDKINWGKVDRSSGKVTFNAAMQTAANTRKPYTLYPAVIGGKNWEPAAYDPAKHLFIIPAIESSIEIQPAKISDMHPKAGVFNGGAGFAKPVLAGSISAFDLTTGTLVWKRHFRSPNMSGALVTAGGLVFAGMMEGKLLALDEATGKTVWQSAPEASGIVAPPITYSLDGKQYVAVVSGLGGVVPKFFAAAVPWLQTVKKGSLVYAYELGSNAMSGGTKMNGPSGTSGATGANDNAAGTGKMSSPEPMPAASGAAPAASPGR